MRRKTILTTLLALLISEGAAHAFCNPTNGLINLFGVVAWENVLPIKIGGIPILPAPADIVDTPDLTSLPVCSCPVPHPPWVAVGIPVSFWEPARIIEAVKDPYCMPTLGVTIANPAPGTLGGGNLVRTSGQVTAGTFSQIHYFVSPLMALMGLVDSSLCSGMETSFDIAYLTELDPLWNSDSLAALINPEALLFGNPLAAMSCLADSMSAQFGLPLDPLFWCMGSFGSAYPLTGHTSDDNYTEGAAALSSRFIYKMGRELLLSDPAITLCGSLPTPIWVKSHYRLQIITPVPGGMGIPIGRMATIWGWGKNLPPGSDNFSFLMFRKRGCCGGAK